MTGQLQILSRFLSVYRIQYLNFYLLEDFFLYKADFLEEELLRLFVVDGQDVGRDEGKSR